MRSYALVIGNNNYECTTKLNNAVKDAQDIKSKLENLGFDVLLSTDFKQSEFSKIISEYKSKITSTEEDVVSLFFYSGHGIQVDGKNYLLPIDASVEDESSAKYTAISFDEIIKDICQVNVRVKIFVLDACRDNPFKGNRSVVSNGLAPIYAPKGSLIAFSTSPGETATDGIPGENSIYTQALLTHIGVPNITIEDCFKRVRESVYSLTNEKQLSWEHTSLIGKYCFNNGSNINVSKTIPYKENVVKDILYTNNGSDFSEIIYSLKSCNWYTQEPAIKVILDKTPTDFPDRNEQFLLGRNILQVAVGGERTIGEIFNSQCKLERFLNNWIIDKENHLLNGILFEMFFNHDSTFRGMSGLKAFYLEQICSLSENEKYKMSFDFINEVLKPFSNYLLFVPKFNPVAIPLDFVFKKTKIKNWLNEEEEIIAMSSISKEGKKLLEVTPSYNDCERISFKELQNKIYQWFHIPKQYITICKNMQIQPDEKVLVPDSWSIDSLFMDYLKI